MGTTLSANPMQFACLRATLSDVMTPKAYARMDRGAARLAQGLTDVIDRQGLPWHVVRVGARVEFICAPGPLKNGSDAARAHQPRTVCRPLMPWKAPFVPGACHGMYIPASR